MQVPPPNEATRRDILSLYLKKVPLEGGVDIASLASSTSNFTGAGLVGVCREAALASLRDIRAPLLGTCLGARRGSGEDRESSEEVAVTMDHLLTAAAANSAG